MLDARFWKKYFEVYDTLNELIPYQELLDAIVEKLDVKEGDLVFDAGSGTGNLAVKLTAKGAKVIGMDISEAGAELHKKKIPGAEVIIQSLAEPLPFPDNHFDKICSNNTIYAIAKEKRPAIFAEFYRVLKPGGRIVISNVKNGFSPFRIYAYHIKKRVHGEGFVNAVLEILKYLGPAGRIFYYNFFIKKENKGGGYSFMKTNEQETLLSNAHFSIVGEAVSCYARQGLLNIGSK